ncbi:hypothetical protein Hdeb2414_s0225g00839531 [Helianthus debilis subsp. tardiflorus]
MSNLIEELSLLQNKHTQFYLSVTHIVGVQLPSVEVRYKNLHVEAECEVVHGKPLPTLWNSFQSLLSVVTACQNLYKNSFTYHCLPGHGFRFIILFLR